PLIAYHHKNHPHTSIKSPVPQAKSSPSAPESYYPSATNHSHPQQKPHHLPQPLAPTTPSSSPASHPPFSICPFHASPFQQPHLPQHGQTQRGRVARGKSSSQTNQIAVSDLTDGHETTHRARFVEQASRRLRWWRLRPHRLHRPNRDGRARQHAQRGS